MVKAFIFDMDGVIIDSEPLHFAVDLMILEQFGLNLEKEKLEQYVGMTNPEMWRLIKEQYGVTNTVEEMIEAQLARKLTHLDEIELEPISGIRELLLELRNNNISIGLASSSPRVFIEAVLTKFNIIDQFSCIVSGEEVDRGKPAPDVYLEAARMLKVKPEDCVVLEDAKHGVKAAKSAGMQCIGFVNPNSGNQDLSEADFAVTSIGEISVHHLLKGAF
ncbi:phosphatase [Paenibacillus montaniterrae]|uniref:Phosphatase n=1 Tax=Paenibacillus montaniterrae TaxID=429341 RepID=A0A919YTF0_9BACL|nr:HAD family phosphatase [Paenibacillus montaniterrae]GIP18091.1 phosphatase [Paenibacillus montaniterrae]